MKMEPISALVSADVYQNVLESLNQPIPWEKLRNQTVLLTGAGSSLSDDMALALLTENDLHGTGIRVLALTQSGGKPQYSGLLNRPDFALVEQEKGADIQTGHKADFVLHMEDECPAEQGPVDALTDRVKSTIQALEYARRNESKGLLLVSGAGVYGAVHSGVSCLTEETVGYLDHTSSENAAAVGKRTSETLCASYASRYGMHIQIARLGKACPPAAADTIGALLLILLRGEDGAAYNIADPKASVERSASIFAATPEVLSVKRLEKLGWTPRKA